MMFLIFRSMFFLSAGLPAVVFSKALYDSNLPLISLSPLFFLHFPFRRIAGDFPFPKPYTSSIPLHISLSSSFFLIPCRCVRSMLQRHDPLLFTPDRRRPPFIHKMTAGKIFIKLFPNFGKNRQKKEPLPRILSRERQKKREDQDSGAKVSARARTLRT